MPEARYKVRMHTVCAQRGTLWHGLWLTIRPHKIYFKPSCACDVARDFTCKVPPIACDVKRSGRLGTGLFHVWLARLQVAIIIYQARAVGVIEWSNKDSTWYYLCPDIVFVGY